MTDPIEIVLEHLQVLRIEPGDVLVMKIPGCLSVAQHERLHAAFEEVFPGYKAIVIEDGADLGVVRQEHADGS
jgi:hypothetical protein